MSYNKLEVGKRIDFIRLQKGMSKNEFAKLINISKQHLSRVISNEKGLSVEKVIELSEKTGFSTDFILLGKDADIDINMKKKLNEIEMDFEDLYTKLKEISILTKKVTS